MVMPQPSRKLARKLSCDESGQRRQQQQQKTVGQKSRVKTGSDTSIHGFQANSKGALCPSEANAVAASVQLQLLHLMHLFQTLRTTC
jgi:hypothetical protein